MILSTQSHHFPGARRSINGGLQASFSELPRPELLTESALNLVVCITPWGPRDVSTSIANHIRQLAASDENVDLPELPSLSKIVQRLSEQVHQEFNATEYTAAAEICAFRQEGRLLQWAQVGGPGLWVLNAVGMFPLGAQATLTSQSKSMSRLAPLPASLLGVERTCHSAYGQLRLESEDRILLIQHPRLPIRGLADISAGSTLSECVRSIALADTQASGTASFWIGEIKIGAQQ